MSENKNVIRPTDETALLLARKLIRTARYGALAVNDSKDSFPLASRALIATDIDGAPITLISQLSSHTKAIENDNRVSIMFGEIGKGDPLAHPRISLKAFAEKISSNNDTLLRIRQRFLNRHPKAGLYVDFADFSFFKLDPISASLNGGFGKAFELSKDDMLIKSNAMNDLAQIEGSAIDHMNADHQEAIDLYASSVTGKTEKNWHIATIDCQGMELAKSDQLIRIELDEELQSADALRTTLAKLADKLRNKS